MIKIKLPFLKKKETFPEQFFALDLGGKNLKIFLLDCAGNSAVPLGSRKIARSGSPAEDAANLKGAVSQLREDFPEASALAVAGLSGPYTTAFTTVVRSSTSRDVQELVDHAREEARRSAEDELRLSLGDSRLKVSEVEAEILEVKEADKLEVFLFTSFADESYLTELSQLVKPTGLELWGFSSLPFNLVTELACAAAADHKEQLNALIFDVGGSKTEVSLAFGGELMDTKSFWWEFQENGNPAAFLDLWLEAVSAILSEFEGVETFPAKIYLAGGAAAFPGLLEVVASYPWSRDHPFEIAPEVVPLEEDRVSASLGQVALRLRSGSSTKEEKEEEKEPEPEVPEGGEE
uniref:SHS2 domain-containing protein n=1 Tax=candidate division WWE3 bacterium TaxID=2053526 RepID=A0A832E0Y7_UNCKA